MKIQELLSEATVESRLREQPRNVAVSNSWDKTWDQESSRFGDLSGELENFLLDKCWFDPPPLHGKKDGPVGAGIPSLRGMFHAHMHFGKVIIIYKIEENTLRLYLAGDHKIVEKDHLSTLGEQVKKLNKQTWTTNPGPERKVQLDITPAVHDAATQLLELLSEDSSTRNMLYRFAEDLRNVPPLLPYISYEPLLQDVPLETIQKLVKSHLKI